MNKLAWNLWYLYSAVANDVKVSIMKVKTFLVRLQGIILLTRNYKQYTFLKKFFNANRTLVQRFHHFNFLIFHKVYDQYLQQLQYSFKITPN